MRLITTTYFMVLVTVFATVGPAWGGSIKAAMDVVQHGDREIRIRYGNSQTSHVFDQPIYRIVPNHRHGIVLVVTHDKQAADAYLAETGNELCPRHQTCQSFLIDAGTGQKHPYAETCPGFVLGMWSPDGEHAFIGNAIIGAKDIIAHIQNKNVPKTELQDPEGCHPVLDVDSLIWVSNRWLTYSGGQCGTHFDFLVDVQTGIVESYCAEVQTPGYGCPDHFPSPAEYQARLAEIKQTP